MRKWFVKTAGGYPNNPVRTQLDDTCQHCGAENQKVMYDSLLIPMGGWGYVCQTCFERFGVGLGASRATKFEVEDD